jgi:hypothetical protein
VNIEGLVETRNLEDLLNRRRQTANAHRTAASYHRIVDLDEFRQRRAGEVLHIRKIE